MSLYFKWNAENLKLLVRNSGVLREIATQGHSRSFILQSVTGQQGVAYRHIILRALSVTFPKKYALKWRKIALVNCPSLIWNPRREELPRVFLYFQKIVIDLHFCRCMYGSIFIQICSVGSKRRVFSASECVLAVQGRSGSSKVDDFGTNRKRVYDFLLVRHCDYGPVLRLHRFWDTATYWLKLPIVATFLLHLSLIRRPRSLCSLWNFALMLTVRKLFMGLFSSEDRMIVAGVVLAWYQHVTDRRSEGRTVRWSDRTYHG